MVMLDAGHLASARRRQMEDYIELRDENGWPGDERFYHQDLGSDFDLAAEVLRRVGLDPSVALRHHASDGLLVWLGTYENNSTGEPWVGHAAVSRSNKAEAVLQLVETAPGVPETVALNLAYFAGHAAAATGVERILTDLTPEIFALAGFVPTPDGRRVLDTGFLDADPDGVRALLEAELQDQTPWGRDRDVVGRHIPPTLVGRALHRLRYGRSGRRPRAWVEVER